jgi:hypothetical protein
MVHPHTPLVNDYFSATHLNTRLSGVTVSVTLRMLVEKWVRSLPKCEGCGRPSIFWTDGFPHTGRGTLYWCSRRCAEKDGSDHSEWDDPHFVALRKIVTSLETPDLVQDRLQLLVSAGFLPVIEEIAREFFVLPQDLVGKSRIKGIAAARRRLWLELRERHDLSFPRIGKLMGLDHTTILSGCEKARQERDKT